MVTADECVTHEQSPVFVFVEFFFYHRWFSEVEACDKNNQITWVNCVCLDYIDNIASEMEKGFTNSGKCLTCSLLFPYCLFSLLWSKFLIPFYVIVLLQLLLLVIVVVVGVVWQ